jgi:tetratricopeptide (TPR) repeat protein
LSRCRQQEAIDLYGSLDRPYNLAIAWTSLFSLELELGRIDDAERALDRVDYYSNLVSYRRGISQSRVYRGEILARRGDAGSARRTIERGLDELREHTVYDLTCHEIAARACRLIGDTDAALAQIEKGLAASEPFPWIHGMMLQEGARLRLALGDPDGAQQMARKADALMEGLGIPERVLGGLPAEYGTVAETDGSAGIEGAYLLLT